MANYVLTLPLRTEIWQEHILEKRLNIARLIYNSCLNEILKRNRKSKNDLIFKEIKSLYVLKDETNEKKQKDLIQKQINCKYKELEKKYQISAFELNKYAKDMINKFSKNIGSQMGQELAERAYSTFEKLKYNKAKKVRFKSFGEFYSVREKTNKTGLRFYLEESNVKWLGLEIPVILKEKDEYTMNCFKGKIKYCRLIKRIIRGKNKYYIQITFEGIPPQKHKINNGEVGIDIGTSTIAIVGDNNIKFEILAKEIECVENDKRLLLRKLDRQRRANNPDKFNEDGTIKPNKKKWNISKNYIKTKSKLKEIQRKLSAKREQSHNILANEILEMGDVIKVETMDFKTLQSRTKNTEISEKTGKFKRKKRFGKTIANRSPAKLLEIIDRKLNYIGRSLIKINTYKVKASQLNHITKEYTKKKLSQRWVKIDGNMVQRDLYSAFLIKNVKENLEEVDIDKAKLEFDSFLKLHNIEIERLKHTKTLKSMGI